MLPEPMTARRATLAGPTTLALSAASKAAFCSASWLEDCAIAAPAANRSVAASARSVLGLMVPSVPATLGGGSGRGKPQGDEWDNPDP